MVEMHGRKDTRDAEMFFVMHASAAGALGDIVRMRFGEI